MRRRAKNAGVIKYTAVPLPGTFMLTSMLGFIIVVVYTAYGRLDITWGFAIGLVFVIMFVASIVSITPTFPKELD